MKTSPRPAPRFDLSGDDVVALGRGEAVVRDNFLGARRARALARSLASWRGALAPARMGRGAARFFDRAERGDELAWIDPTEAAPALAPLVEGFRAIQHAVNREAYLGLRRFDIQIACYRQPGARYARHADAFRARFPVNRALTAIYYANPGWTPAHGGALRLYLPDDQVDVEPILDRTVIFLSDRLEHEVLPTYRPRWAITAWFYAAD